MTNERRTPVVTRRHLLRWMAAASASGVVACGGGGGDDPGACMASLQAVESRLEAASDATTGRASAAQMLAHLSADTAFSTVGFSATGDVYAIFTRR